ncbi:protein TraE (plasmid) [Aeromonas caviae]|uniref:type IV conjugative transfer system protein TraE n=1 Tax=Aeromonas TaxID=642 RepID=UPI0015DC902C|nr:MULTISPECIES: type IV conjugative transfer system protein TraE [Aeromonas]MDD9212859.1 type IV conjugative transfer system protein TraE [Aeromonas dhakensis]BBT68682.1 protein TraE [Aeromonas caviae]
MELTARDSTNKVVAVVMLVLLALLTLSIASNIVLALQNKHLTSTREKIVTPMAYDAPFVISEANSSPAHMQMMALSFMALRLNISPETVDTQHQFLLGFVKPGAQPDFKVVLAQEAQRIKQNEVNSAFYQTQLQVFPTENRIDIRGVLKTWIGNGQPKSDLKHYSLVLAYQNGITSIVKFLEVNDDKQ